MNACNEKQAELEAEIERLKADNEALTMWNNASAETIQKLSERQGSIPPKYLTNN